MQSAKTCSGASAGVASAPRLDVTERSIVVSDGSLQCIMWDGGKARRGGAGQPQQFSLIVLAGETENQQRGTLNTNTINKLWEQSQRLWPRMNVSAPRRATARAPDSRWPDWHAGGGGPSGTCSVSWGFLHYGESQRSCRPGLEE